MAVLLFCDLKLALPVNEKRLKDFLDQYNSTYKAIPEGVKVVLVGNYYKQAGISEEKALTILKELIKTLKQEGYDFLRFECTCICTKTGVGIKELFDQTLPKIINSTNESITYDDATKKSEAESERISKCKNHILNHPIRYSLGLLLALTVILMLTIPGVTTSGAIASSITGSTTGGIFFALALGLAAFLLPMLTGYSLFWLGAATNKLGSVVGAGYESNKIGKFIRRCGKICLGKKSLSNYSLAISRDTEVNFNNSCVGNSEQPPSLPVIHSHPADLSFNGQRSSTGESTTLLNGAGQVLTKGTI